MFILGCWGKIQNKIFEIVKGIDFDTCRNCQMALSYGKVSN